MMDKRAWAVWTEGQSDPEYTKLYQLMTTTPGEGVFAKGQAD